MQHGPHLGPWWRHRRGLPHYDLFDLGEFDQKGSVATKNGTKDELMAVIQACHDHGLQVYADAVLNHKMAADFEEDFEAIPFNPSNHYEAMGEARSIRTWMGFNVPARNKRYSSMDWHCWHFDAVDYNSLDPGTKAIWRMKDKDFDGTLMKEMPGRLGLRLGGGGWPSAGLSQR